MVAKKKAVRQKDLTQNQLDNVKGSFLVLCQQYHETGNQLKFLGAAIDALGGEPVLQPTPEGTEDG